MKRLLTIFLLLLWSTEGARASVRITSIDFKGLGDPSFLEITGDGKLEFEKIDNQRDKQVVIEIKNATLERRLSRKIDTSSFVGKVLMISPFQVTDKPATVRVVLQLSEHTDTAVDLDGNVLRVKIPAANGAASAADSAANTATDLGRQADAAANPPTNPPTDPIDEIVASRASRRFQGRPITLHVRDVDVVDVFRLISETSGFNIVVSDEVKGKLTISLVDVPWDQALDTVLQTLRLGAERNNNILRIVTLQRLTTEKQEELRAVQAVKASTARITRIFSISFADLDGLKEIVSKFTTPSSGENAPSLVQADKRTNSIIVQDIPENIEKIRKLIEMLDTQTPQVMIEAKVVEASEQFGKTMAGSLGFGSSPTASTPFFAAFNGVNPVDQLIGTPGVFADGSEAKKDSGGGARMALSPTLSFLPGVRLNAVLNMAESESQVNVISSPKTVVLNKEKATIVHKTPVFIPTTVTPSTGLPYQVINVSSAELSLDAIPTVTNEGSVLMKLTLKRDVPFESSGNTAVSERNMTTTVLVESGSTLVIGGVYSMTTGHSEDGFPFLRKIPILGALFGSENNRTDRSELFFFITPRILNPKEAGIGG